jgi:hypothetical protein
VRSIRATEAGSRLGLRPRRWSLNVGVVIATRRRGLRDLGLHTLRGWYLCAKSGEVILWVGATSKTQGRGL